MSALVEIIPGNILKKEKTAMIKHTLPVLEALGFSNEQILLSLEMRMKCAIGKCGRCNIGSKYVCKDGPVFSYAELLDNLSDDMTAVNHNLNRKGGNL